MSEGRVLEHCDCLTWCRDYDDFSGEKHHRNCPKHKTEKTPRLFYYEEGVDCFIPTDQADIEMIVGENLGDGESIEIEFKRMDMTDYEWRNMPEL